MQQLSRVSMQRYEELRRLWLADRLTFEQYHLACQPFYEKKARIKASQTEAESKQAQTKGGDYDTNR